MTDMNTKAGKHGRTPAGCDQVELSDGSWSGVTRQELWELIKPALEDEIAGRVLPAEEVHAFFREKIRRDLQS